MPIEFACPECARRLRVPDGSAGKHCMCPGCQVVVPIPSSSPQTTLNNRPNESQQSLEGKIQVACPQCQHLLISDAKLEGTQGLCLQCKAVFVISTTPTNKSVSQASFVFSCPSCHQLHNGKPEMAGRKGKCVACKTIFIIKPQPEASAYETNHSETAIAPSKSIPSSNPAQVAKDERTIKPTTRKNSITKTSDATGSNVTRASNLVPEEQLTIACPTCAAHLQAPVSWAGKTVQCSHCRSQMVVPQSDIAPLRADYLLASNNSANNNLWDNDLFAAIPAPDPFAHTNTPRSTHSARASSKNPYAPPGVGLGLDSGFAGSSDEQIRRKHLGHEASIRSFGLLFKIGSVIGVLSGVVYFLLASAQLFGGQQVVIGIFLFLLALITIGLSILQWFVAVGLRELSNFGRIGGTVIGVIGLLGIPFGTLISTYFLYLLWSKKGHVVFSPRYQRVREATPHIVYKTHIVVKILLGLLVAMIVVPIIALVIMGLMR